MPSKKCSKCGLEKEANAQNFFEYRPARACIWKPKCKACQSIENKQNAEKIREYNQKYMQENADRLKAYRKEYCKKNSAIAVQRAKEWNEKYGNSPEVKARKAAKQNEWRRANNSVRREQDKARYANRILRKPCWFGEFDFLVMSEAYKLAVMRETSVGGKWHVDHIIPLKAEMASGLHVWSNVQVVPESYNVSKQNRFDPVVGPELYWSK